MYNKRSKISYWARAFSWWGTIICMQIRINKYVHTNTFEGVAVASDRTPHANLPNLKVPCSNVSIPLQLVHYFMVDEITKTLFSELIFYIFLKSYFRQLVDLTLFYRCLNYQHIFCDIILYVSFLSETIFFFYYSNFYYISNNKMVHYYIKLEKFIEELVQNLKFLGGACAPPFFPCKSVTVKKDKIYHK